MGDPFARAVRAYLLRVVMPLWIAAGAVDHGLHRRSRIEATSGVAESALHLGGIALTTLPVLAALNLEIDAGVLCVLGAGYVAHAGMTVWDVAYASRRREIVPLEQHVHAMLELLPFTALSLLVVAHHDQALALVGAGTQPPRFAFRRKTAPIDDRSATVLACAFALLVAVPYVEEFVRCLRHRSRRADR